MFDLARHAVTKVRAGARGFVTRGAFATQSQTQSSSSHQPHSRHVDRMRMRMGPFHSACGSRTSPRWRMSTSPAEARSRATSLASVLRERHDPPPIARVASDGQIVFFDPRCFASQHRRGESSAASGVSRRLPPRLTPLPQRRLRTTHPRPRRRFPVGVAAPASVADRTARIHQLVDELLPERLRNGRIRRPPPPPTDDDPPPVGGPLRLRRHSGRVRPQHRCCRTDEPDWASWADSGHDSSPHDRVSSQAG